MTEPNNIDPKAVKVLNEFAKNKLPNNLEWQWLDDILYDLEYTTRRNYNSEEKAKAKLAITSKINKIVDTIIGEDVKEIEEPSPDVWQTFNENERMDYAINRSIRIAINRAKAELRKRKEEVLK